MAFVKFGKLILFRILETSNIRGVCNTSVSVLHLFRRSFFDETDAEQKQKQTSDIRELATPIVFKDHTDSHYNTSRSE